MKYADLTVGELQVLFTYRWNQLGNAMNGLLISSSPEDLKAEVAAVLAVMTEYESRQVSDSSSVPIKLGKPPMSEMGR